ncbi:MAG TPA: isoamylase early set domain-containing protein [Gemmatimonadales bacterium]|nr:isoamylase early set domain-containing protein [Gemmatimonadales bacterium]
MTPIDPRVHRVLDGDEKPDALDVSLRRQVQRLDEAVALLAAAPCATSVAERVMTVIARPTPTRARRLVHWLLTPRAVVLRLRPVWSLAVAAGILALVLFPLPEPGIALREGEGIAQFVARFPGARSVAVVGSFNDWRPESIPLDDSDHDGVWGATVVLPAGAHEYMFVVDGERWIADPLAERFVEDDFGRENSVVIVRPRRESHL